MDYDKLNDKIDDSVRLTETKVVEVFKSNLNFIRNLRKYVTNESKEFREVVVTNAIIIGILFIVLELILGMFGYNSILGMVPKLLTVIILISYIFLYNTRRNSK